MLMRKASSILPFLTVLRQHGGRRFWREVLAIEVYRNAGCGLNRCNSETRRLIIKKSYHYQPPVVLRHRFLPSLSWVFILSTGTHVIVCELGKGMLF